MTAAAISSASATVLDRLVEHLRARDATFDGQALVAAIRWTDPKGEWEPTIDLMQARVEEFAGSGDWTAPRAQGSRAGLCAAVPGPD